VKYSQACVDLVKRAEGFRSRTYKCPAGLDTIGYGTTRGVRPGMVVTEAEATQMLIRDLDGAARDVLRLVKAPLTPGQFDALVSFVFNVGATSFAKSTMLVRLNAGDYEGAAAQFGRWVYAKGKKLPGLVERRRQEEQLFRAGTVRPDGEERVT
jgi:lysozyme